MERPMRSVVLSSVAAFALTTVPALAQDNTQQTDANSDAPAAQPAPTPQTADEANAQVQPVPPSTAVIEPGAASGAGSVVTTYPGTDAGPPASALNKHYPVCTRKLQDECQNPGEGGAPGRSRALKYWPGKPASEGK